MFQIITPDHENKIESFVEQIEHKDIDTIVQNLENIIQEIHTTIPEKKRISYGRYNIIKRLGIFLYPIFIEKQIDIQKLVTKVYNGADYDPFIKSLMVQIFSIYGEKTGELSDVLELFEKAATNERWEVRECSAGFVRKLVKKYPKPMHDWYIEMVTSENAMQRRFASESIRPVADNKYMQKTPEFAFSILKYLFKESDKYPRTSVGNSLSDWMRVNEEITLPIVKEDSNKQEGVSS